MVRFTIRELKSIRNQAIRDGNIKQIRSLDRYFRSKEGAKRIARGKRMIKKNKQPGNFGFPKFRF